MNSRPCALMYLIIILLTAVPTSAIAHDQEKTVDWPDTPAGRWLRDYIASFSSDGEKPLIEFAEKHYSKEYREKETIQQIIKGHESVRKQIGALTAASVTADGDYKVRVVARSKKVGIWLKISLELKSSAPHDKKTITIVPTRGPDQAPVPEYDKGWTTVDELVQRVHADSKAPALAVAVIWRGKLTDRAVSGIRLVGTEQEAMIEDRFHLGSITKSVTATVAIEPRRRGRAPLRRPASRAATRPAGGRARREIPVRLSSTCALRLTRDLFAHDTYQADKGADQDGETIVGQPHVHCTEHDPCHDRRHDKD